MGMEKQGLKGGGGYVGGFLHLFDWNAKSRKKLFSTKSDLQEQPKQKKRTDGNLPTTRFHMMDEDDMIGGSSFKGSSDYSCASSVTDDDGYGTKAPGVVARLMGLDSLPTSNFSDTYSNPSFDSQSLRDSSAPYIRKNLELRQEDLEMEEVPFTNNRTSEPKPQKMMTGRAIDKFQTETLPPKSAKSIPITHHKLLSPIKNSGFISSSNPAHIMEAASKIPLVGSSSSSTSSLPLKIKDLKEKVENSSRKPSKVSENSRKPVESNAAKYLKGQSMNKSWNGSSEPKPFRVLEEVDSSTCINNNGKKSISLALQAKANVQKREGLNLGGGRSSFGQREDSDGAQPMKSQPNTQRSTHKKPSINSSSSSVLRQNNQKQNSSVDRGKSSLKSSVSSSNTQSRKPVPQKSSSKVSGNSKANNKKQVPYSSTTNNSVNRRKRSIEDGDFHHIEKNGSLDKSHRSGNAMHCSGTDVVSFTFSAPISRSMPSPNISVEKNSNGIFADNRGKKALINFDGNISSSKSASLSYNVIGGDALSTLLEQKLRELTGNNAPSSASVLQDSCRPYRAGNNSIPVFHDKRNRDRMDMDDLNSHVSSTDPLGLVKKQYKPQGAEETSECSSNDYEYRKILHGRHPSPISVLEPSFLAESCNSSDTTDSNSTEGYKQISSSVQAQELLGASFSKRTYMMDIDTELSDSASSIAAKREVVGSTTRSERDYVKEVLSDIESMFQAFTLGKASNVVNPHMFEQLESQRPSIENQEEPKLRRKSVFDCVSECMDSRCRVWGKGLAAVSRKDRLAEDVYKEIKGWEEMKDFMVDELVDKDMSDGQYGKWLDYQAEAFELGVDVERRLLNSLINEVVADILVL